MARISASNQIRGTVVGVQEGSVDAIVSIEAGPLRVDSCVTLDAVRELGLSAGGHATALFSAAAARIAKDEAGSPNHFDGKVIAVREGAILALVEAATHSGQHLTASIPLAELRALGIKEGADVLVAVDPMFVMLGVEQ